MATAQAFGSLRRTRVFSPGLRGAPPNSRNGRERHLLEHALERLLSDAPEWRPGRPSKCAGQKRTQARPAATVAVPPDAAESRTLSARGDRTRRRRYTPRPPSRVRLAERDHEPPASTPMSLPAVASKPTKTFSCGSSRSRRTRRCERGTPWLLRSTEKNGVAAQLPSREEALLGGIVGSGFALHHWFDERNGALVQLMDGGRGLGMSSPNIARPRVATASDRALDPLAESGVRLAIAEREWRGSDVGTCSAGSAIARRAGRRRGAQRMRRARARARARDRVVGLLARRAAVEARSPQAQLRLPMHRRLNAGGMETACGTTPQSPAVEDAREAQ